MKGLFVFGEETNKEMHKNKPMGTISGRTYPGFCHINPNEEYQLGDEEIDAEVLVDSVAIALQAAEEAEGEDGDGQADQGDHNPYPGDDS